MRQAIFAAAVGTVLLICCLGASAQSILLAADAPISNETGLTLGLVLGAISLVGWGAWQLARYITTQEERIKRLERLEKIEKDGRDDSD